MDHTAFNLQRTPCLPLPRKRSPDGASTKCGGEHLTAAHYSFITSADTTKVVYTVKTMTVSTSDARYTGIRKIPHY